MKRTRKVTPQKTVTKKVSNNCTYSGMLLCIVFLLIMNVSVVSRGQSTFDSEDFTAPINNYCDNPTVVFEGIAVNESTADAMASGTTTSCSGTDTIDVWYSFTPAVTSDYFISLCGSSFDTTLGLFNDCNDTEITCNDDYCGGQSKLDVALTSGVTYLIRVSGAAGAVGDFTLLITAYAVPTNNYCDNPIIVFEGVAVNESTAYAMASGTTTSCSGTDTIDVWYSFTPTVTNGYSISLCGSSFDTTLGLFNDCNDTEITCNDDYCGGGQSELEAVLTGGVTYLIRVSGAGGAVGDFTLLITGDTAPTNNYCDNPTVVFEGVAVNDSTEGATASGATTSCSGTDTIDLWYSFTPAVTSDYFISLCGSSFDTTLGLFSDCNDTEIACNDDYCDGQSKLDVALTSGVTYLIRVSGAGGAVGNFNLLIAAYVEVTDTLDPNAPETLIPGGGDPNATESAQIEIENTSDPCGATITVSEVDTDLYQGQHAFNVMGTTLVVETSLADCNFFATISIPFTAADLGGGQWQSLDLMYWDVSTESWVLAAAGNCGDNPVTMAPVGNRFEVEDSVLPTLSSDLGDYGVFWDPAQGKGFVWANIDHTTDFAAAVLVGDFVQNGVVNFIDLSVLGLAWYSEVGDGNWNVTCDISEPNDNIIDELDLGVFVEKWLAGI